MDYVSKCCGQKYTMEVIRAVFLADGRSIPLQTSGQIPEETPVCCGCGEPCKITHKGEETKPSVGGVYCQTCARRIQASGRVPEGCELRYPAGGGTKAHKATCWGCGKTVEFRELSMLVEEQ